MPDDYVATLANVKFWHYQFVRSQAARRHLYWYHEHKKDGNLNDRDIEWILREEGGHTTLLKRDPASGGRPLSWYIMADNHVSLAELFDRGCRLCSCHYLYNLYLRQPVFITKRHHSESTRPQAMARRSARNLHHQIYGTYGLPRHPW